MSDIFQRIQSELDFGYFLDSEGLDYKEVQGSSGEQFHIKCCPSCGDSRWRTYMGVESGLGNCFKCGEKFTKITFVKEHFGLDNWGETFRRCEEVLHDQGWRPVRKAVVVEPDAFEVRLPISEPIPFADGSNFAYLEERGVTKELAAYFNLRFCKFGGWVFKSPEGKQQLQNFSGRIIIPIFDLDRELKTFQGRDVTGTSDRKYLFPVQLPGTGRYLYNGQNVVACEHVVLGEGAFDVIAIKAALDLDPATRNVVAIGSFGKHLSHGHKTNDDQLSRLSALKTQGLKRVTIMWDGEPAALTAALDASKLIRSVGLTPYVALLPAGKDPNEVPASEVVKAFYGAKEWNLSTDVKWRLRNPYS